MSPCHKRISCLKQNQNWSRAAFAIHELKIEPLKVTSESWGIRVSEWVTPCQIKFGWQWPILRIFVSEIVFFSPGVYKLHVFQLPTNPFCWKNKFYQSIVQKSRSCAELFPGNLHIKEAKSPKISDSSFWRESKWNEGLFFLSLWCHRFLFWDTHKRLPNYPYIS